MTTVNSLVDAAFLRRIPKVGAYVVIAFMVAHAIILAILFHPGFQERVTLPFERLTGGLVPHALSGSILQLMILIGGLAMTVGGLRLRHVGLRRYTVANGILITLVFWGSAQLIVAALALFQGGHPLVNDVLRSIPSSTGIGVLILAPFGNALVEEVLYRGFLFPQLYLLTEHWTSMTRGRRLAIAVCVSQLFFGVSHISAGRALDLRDTELALYLLHAALVGAFFAILYLRTENLYAVAGIHTLINNPLSFYLTPVDPSFIIILLGLTLMFFSPAFDRWSRTVRLPHWSHVGANETKQ